MAEYVKIKCCGDCIQYNWKKHKCRLGATEEGKAQDHFYRDCSLGIYEEETHDKRTETHGVSLDMISRQAAIDAMCSDCWYDCDKSEFVYDAPIDKQVIICPEHYALSTLPSAQPEITEEEVAEYVSKNGFVVVPSDYLEQLEKETSAQPDIIRCKDCKYGGYEQARPNKYHPCDMAFPAHWRCYYYKKFIPIVTQDDFCSKAERRTDERSD